MSDHPLDRAVWNALTHAQAPLAIGDARARRFAPDVSPFGAVDEFTDVAVAALGRLVVDHGSLALLQPGEIVVPPGTVVDVSAAGVQMVAGPIDAPEDTRGVMPLTDGDVPDMIALATLTAPGPFLARTNILGDFVGVRENGRLIAMASERLKPEGFTEVSGVCTHPGARGRGLAAMLSRLVASRIQARGEAAFLHAYASNHGAISLYERLGFRLRCQVTLTVLAPIRGQA